MDAEVNPGLNFWVDGHTWYNASDRLEGCRMYGQPDHAHPVTPTGTLSQMSQVIANLSHKAMAFSNLSVLSYVCLHDTEMECDGIYSYDRTPKFSSKDTDAIHDANLALIGTPVKCEPLTSSESSSQWPRWMLA